MSKLNSEIWPYDFGQKIEVGKVALGVCGPSDPRFPCQEVRTSTVVDVRDGEFETRNTVYTILKSDPRVYASLPEGDYELMQSVKRVSEVDLVDFTNVLHELAGGCGDVTCDVDCGCFVDVSWEHGQKVIREYKESLRNG